MTDPTASHAHDEREAAIQHALAGAHMATVAAETAALRRAQAINTLVQACGGNQSEAARRLGKDQSTINKLLRRHTPEQLADTTYRYGDPVGPTIIDDMIAAVGSGPAAAGRCGDTDIPLVALGPASFPVAVTLTDTGVSGDMGTQALAVAINALRPDDSSNY